MKNIIIYKELHQCDSIFFYVKFIQQSTTRPSQQINTRRSIPWENREAKTNARAYLF